MEKIDARKLGPEGRETLRKMVLRLNTQSGMTGVELAYDRDKGKNCTYHL
ncbi:hypothetical protein [Thauera aminoaromatica]|uniref:Uncharacterized protein n=1 Tax=Thauera aminoaromatica TaxID=164330 RepID=B8F0G3_THASP|nr:hypothetical protein [Thauera aminoaromatica]ACK55129.1 hypothetical protein Tmz1t_2395 [Thauera aminoaromatica]